MDKEAIVTGNAADSQDNRGWFVGYFLKGKNSLRGSDEVEIKWSAHAQNDEHEEWVEAESRATVVITVRWPSVSC